MRKVLDWFTRGAEFIAAMSLAAIFLTFLLQILFRYAPFLDPVGWSVVLISLLWVFVIFFGCAFIVRDVNHVAFDVLYLAAPRGVRTVFALISAVLMVVAMVFFLPAMWDEIFANRLMELKKIQTIRLPITGGKIAQKWLFAPFVLLMAVIALRSSWRIYTVLRFGPPESEIEKILGTTSDGEEATK